MLQRDYSLLQSDYRLKRHRQGRASRRVISGIRPQIAQTIIQLGLDLTVTSKATMADAFQLALRRVGKAVVDRV